MFIDARVSFDLLRVFEVILLSSEYGTYKTLKAKFWP